MDPSQHNSEVSQTWSKFSASAKKVGFRQGAVDGKEKYFQTGFDKGYLEGFQSGFTSGRQKGVQRFLKQTTEGSQRS